jgi:diacylglycerol kinase family enzyme
MKGAELDFILHDKKDEGYLEKLKKIEADIVVICGGDGTISYIVNILKDKDIVFGVIPLGSFNHFAKDNNVPLDIHKALDSLIYGKVIEIDLAEVNGRVIINNSSIGIYTKTVIERKNLKYNKIIKVIISLIKVLIRFPVYKFRVKAGDKDYNIKTSFVFVGNNFYHLNLSSLGSRDSIGKEILSVFFSKSSSRITFLKFALRLLFNKLEAASEFEIIYTKRLLIESSLKVIDVSVDGEVLHMNPPLNYQILEKKIKLKVPGSSND